jgi:hypothetical protein
MVARLLVASLALGLAACSDRTYSAQTMCGGRLPNWQAPSAGIGELALLQPVTITQRNAIRWNGKEISLSTLDNYLRLIKNMTPAPQVILRAEGGADCAAVRAVRTKIETILQCRKSGACGEETGWRRWPGADPEA